MEARILRSPLIDEPMDLDSLAGCLTGRMILPGDDEYESSRQVHQAAVDARPFAPRLAVPPLLRMWKQVQSERARVAFSSHLSRADRPRVLASLLGITEPQAKAHLAEVPLENAMASATRRGTNAPRVRDQRPPGTPPRPSLPDGGGAEATLRLVPCSNPRGPGPGVPPVVTDG